MGQVNWRDAIKRFYVRSEGFSIITFFATQHTVQPDTSTRAHADMPSIQNSDGGARYKARN